jgi:hypothetical protein
LRMGKYCNPVRADWFERRYRACIFHGSIKEVYEWTQ